MKLAYYCRLTHMEFYSFQHRGHPIRNPETFWQMNKSCRHPVVLRGFRLEGRVRLVATVTLFSFLITFPFCLFEPISAVQWQLEAYQEHEHKQKRVIWLAAKDCEYCQQLNNYLLKYLYSERSLEHL